MTEEFRLPSLDLLDLRSRGADPVDRFRLEQRARQLEGVMASFGIHGMVVEVRPGPLYTAFYVDMPSGSRASQLTALQPDLARAFGAREVLIEAVPGRSALAVMLPNDVREEISLAELVASQAFEDAQGSLPVVLGVSVTGEPVCFDLASLRHLLIAGTTGAGKSLGLHAILVSLLYRLTPYQLRLILIDLKVVELGPYDGIPHLLGPVASRVDEAVTTLRWVVAQMDDRFRMMAAVGVRNLAGFNAKVSVAREHGQRLGRRIQAGYDPQSGEPVFEEEELDFEPLPQIVVAVDELGDLMTDAFDDLDPLIQRLAQRGHIAGIHLVLSTERPSTAIVSGAVKANLSSRLAFRVVSALESRIVLDEDGAERLHGRGDMLLKAAGTNLTRLHGAFVGDHEVGAVGDHWRSQGRPDYVVGLDPSGTRDGKSESSSSMYDLAVRIVIETSNGSTSHLQRKLRIGYNTAAALLEEMERRGLVSHPDHVGRRQVHGHVGDFAPPSISPPRASPRPTFRWPWSR